MRAVRNGRKFFHWELDFFLKKKSDSHNFVYITIRDPCSAAPTSYKFIDNYHFIIFHFLSSMELVPPY